MKQSGYAKAWNAGYLAGLRAGRNFMRQLMYDLSCLALNKTEGMGYDRLNRYGAELTRLHDEFAGIFNGDTKDQEYSKSVLDRSLEQIAGEKFIPWEERYDG